MVIKIKGEPYIRKKGKKFIVEAKECGKTIYLATLPDAKTLLEMLSNKRLDAFNLKASQKQVENKEKPIQKFAQDLLPEHRNKDAKRKYLLGDTKE